MNYYSLMDAYLNDNLRRAGLAHTVACADLDAAIGQHADNDTFQALWHKASLTRAALDEAGIDYLTWTSGNS